MRGDSVRSVPLVGVFAVHHFFIMLAASLPEIQFEGLWAMILKSGEWTVKTGSKSQRLIGTA